MNFKTLFLVFLSLIILRLNLNAQKIDPTFQLPIPISSAEIKAIKIQDDGKILVGGNFSFFEAEKINSLIRLNMDGTLDESFSYDSTGTIDDIEVQSTGTIVINSMKKLIQLNSSGDVINTMDTLKSINTFILQPDDKIVVIGSRKINATSSTPVLYRFNSDLTSDETFNQLNTFNSFLTDLKLQNEKIIVCGYFSSINGIEKNDLARFDINGNLDESFDVGTGTDDRIGSITIQKNGKILIGDTYLNSFNGDNYVPAFIRLNKDGDVDESFLTPFDINGPVSDIFIHDSTIYYEAFHYYSSDSSGTYIFRLDSLGGLDETYTPTVLYDDDNLIMVFTQNSEIISNGLSLKGNSFGLSKYNPNGEYDDSFNPEIGSYGKYKTGSYFEGKFVVAGDFLRIGETLTSKLAMINADGSVNTNFVFDDSFINNAASGREPSQVEMTNDTTIYVALGNEIYKFNDLGEADDQFIRKGIDNPSYFVGKFTFTDDEKIITASPNGVFKLNSDGSKDELFSIPDFNGSGSNYGLKTSSTGIFFNSYFTEVNGLSYDSFVKLNFDGSVDQSFTLNYATDFDISHMNVFDSDEVLLIDSWGDEKMLKLSSNGTVDETFRTNFNNTSPSSFYPYSSLMFKNGILVSCGSSNSLTFMSLEFMSTDGTFDANFKMPDEIEESNNEITMIPADKKSVILLSKFILVNDPEPTYALRLIVNTIPEITGIVEEFSTPKNTPLQLSLDKLIVSDLDNSYPDDFTLVLETGENYSINNLEIIPDEDFAGSLTVPVHVNDGFDDSPSYNLTVEVINQIPEITGTTEDFSTPKNTAFEISLDYLIVSDSDNEYPDDFTLNIHTGENYSINNLEIIPNEDFVGNLTVPVHVNDGIDDSPAYNLTVEVINQIPEITGTTEDFSTPKNTAFEISLDYLIVSDSDNEYPDDFTLQIMAGENYSLNNLEVIPDNDFIGTLTIPIKVNDGIDDSPLYDFSLEVNKASSVDLKSASDIFTIFPNPVISDFNISIKNNLESDISVKLIDMSGSIIKKEVYQKTSILFNETFKTDDIPSGLYVIEIEQSGYKSVEKILIK